MSGCGYETDSVDPLRGRGHKQPLVPALERTGTVSGVHREAVFTCFGALGSPGRIRSGPMEARRERENVRFVASVDPNANL